ncbi:collagen alpha-1(I) chain-like [Mustela putorius furo]|uniref:Collagen alpha-1(I) chain-like n=1 Tax=Mustela putorius furo TaxID=9669 RepID=A0A8U0V344_MUSPF|nr:collagen alpha-1(I) chain-like [Mustela putorius furo]
MPGARQARDVHVADLKAASQLHLPPLRQDCLIPEILQSPAPALAPPPNSRALQTGKPARGATGPRGNDRPPRSHGASGNDRPRHRHGHADRRPQGPEGSRWPSALPASGSPGTAPTSPLRRRRGQRSPPRPPPRPPPRARSQRRPRAPAGTRAAGAGDARCPPAASEAPGSGGSSLRTGRASGRFRGTPPAPSRPGTAAALPRGSGSPSEPARERKEAAPPTPTRGGGSARREHGAPRGFRGNGLGACAAHSRGAPGPDLAGPAPPTPTPPRRGAVSRAEALGAEALGAEAEGRACGASAVRTARGLSGSARCARGSAAPRFRRRGAPGSEPSAAPPARSPAPDPGALAAHRPPRPSPSPSPAPPGPAARPCGSAPCFLLFGARPTLLSPQGWAPAPGAPCGVVPGRPPTARPRRRAALSRPRPWGPCRGEGGRAAARAARGVSVRDASAREALAREAGPGAAPPRGPRGPWARAPGEVGEARALREGLAGSPGEFGARGPRTVARRLWVSVLRRERRRRLGPRTRGRPCGAVGGEGRSPWSREWRPDAGLVPRDAGEQVRDLGLRPFPEPSGAQRQPGSCRGRLLCSRGLTAASARACPVWRPSRTRTASPALCVAASSPPGALPPGALPPRLPARPAVPGASEGPFCPRRVESAESTDATPAAPRPGPLALPSTLLHHLTAAFLAVIPAGRPSRPAETRSLLASGFSSVRRTRGRR